MGKFDADIKSQFGFPNGNDEWADIRIHKDIPCLKDAGHVIELLWLEMTDQWASRQFSMNHLEFNSVDKEGQGTTIYQCTIKGDGYRMGWKRGEDDWLGRIEINLSFVDGKLEYLLMIFPVERRLFSNLFIHNQQDSELLEQCAMSYATPIISYGIPPGFSRSITQHYLDSDGSKELTFEVTGDLLKDGFHIISDAGSSTTPFWLALKENDPSFPFAEGLMSKAPNRVSISFYPGGIDPNIEGRWRADVSPTAFSSFNEVDYGIRVPSTLWAIHFERTKYMLDLLPEGAPTIFLEASSEENFTSRFKLSAGDQVEFQKKDEKDEVAAALSALLKGKNDLVFNTLSLASPDYLSLIELTYEPDNWMAFTLSTEGSGSTKPYTLDVLGIFQLEQIDLSFQIDYKPKSVLQLELFCVTKFLGQAWDISYRPKDYLEGSLAEPKGIKAGTLLAELLPQSFPVQLEELSISDARLSRSLSDKPGLGGETEFSVSLSGRVPMFSDAIILSQLTLDVAKPDGGKTEGSFRGVLELGPVQLGFAAIRHSQGFRLSGAASWGAEGLSLTALLDHLTKTLGVAIPEDVPELSLNEISVQFDTGNNGLRIDCLTEWDVPSGVPVVEGKSKVLLTIMVEANPGGRGRSASLSMRWSLEKGPAGGPTYNIDASVFFSRASQVFTLDLSAPEAGKTIALSQLVTDLSLPSLPTPAADAVDTVFQVSHFSMNYARPGNSFAVAWSRPFEGGILLAEYAQGARSSGASSSPGAPAPRDRQVKVSWLGDNEDAAIGLEDALKLVGGDGVYSAVNTYIPSTAKDMLTFKELGFQYSDGGAQRSVTFTALSKYRGGTEAFVTYQSGAKRGIVAGFVFGKEGSETQDSLIDRLPLDTGKAGIVKDLLKTVDTVLDQVELTHVLVSTVDSTQFHPPALSPAARQPSDMIQGAPPVARPFGHGTMSVAKGVAVGFKVRFGHHPILSKFIKIKELDAQVALGDRVGFRISIPETLELEAGSGNSLALLRPTLEIQKKASQTSFSLGGQLELMLFGESVEVGGWMSVSTRGVSAHLKLEDLSLPPLPSLPGIHFEATPDKPMHLLLGLAFQPPAINLGMQGYFYICSSTPGKRYEGKAGIVLEVVQGAAHPKYLEFAIDEMNLMTVAEAFTGANYFLQLAEDANEVVGDVVDGPFDDLSGGVDSGIDAVQGALEHIEAVVSNVKMESVRFHWANNIVHLPDGNVAMPGVGFRGGLEFLGWNAFASLNFSTQGIPGFTGHFETEPLEIPGVLRIWGDGKGIRELPKDGEPISNLEPSGQLASTTGYWLEPGGPVLQLSTQSSPFLYADLHAELFGFLQTDIHAEVTDEGFSFDFGIGAGDGIRADLGCHWWKDDGKFEAYGDLGIHLHGTLGPIIQGVPATEFDIDTDLEASIRLVVDSESFYCAVDGSFEFEGVRLDMPELEFKVKFESLEDLAAAIWERIKGLAKDIFADFLLPIGEFIAETAEKVGEIAEDAYEFAKESAEKAIEGAKVIVGEVVEIGEAIGEKAEVVAAAAKEVLDGAAEAAGKAVAHIVDEVVEIGEAALELGKKVAAEVEAIVKDIADTVAKAADYVADKAKEAIEYVGRKLAEARQWVADRLKQAAALVNKLGREAEEAVRALVREIEDLVRQIDELAGMIADFFLDIGGDVVDGLETVGEGIGSAASTVGGWIGW